MSDHAEVLVCRSKEREQAGARVVANLVARGIIEAAETDSTLGATGHRPGPKFAEALEDPRDQSFLRLAVNGLEVRLPEVGFELFVSPDGGFPEVSCPDCGRKLEAKTLTARLDQLNDESPVPVRCRGCGNGFDIVDWQPAPSSAFGNLAFAFWNWSPLSKRFIEEVAGWCGDPVVRVYEHV
jgi:ribosomal protein S27E